jgi:hypothetical protein
MHIEAHRLSKNKKSEVPGLGEEYVVAYCGWAAAYSSALEVAHQKATGG